MSNQDSALMAHLLRRAGFGATQDELGGYLAKGYEQTVEELLHPRDAGNLSDDLIRRYHVDHGEMRQVDAASAYWMYRMVTTRCPLEEKIALFWHSLLATGYSKLNQARAQLNQIDMFRNHGLGSLRDLLLELSRDPAMLLWLDNNENHKEAINENFGRELLELFSMGIGNYTEQDVKECSRAFTGWTLANAEYMAVRASKDSIWPYGRISWHFEYRPGDHDDGEKVFLGESGRFNGDDIIDIIVRQDATAQFICTRLFQFFGADDVTEEAQQVVEAMIRSYHDSTYEIRSVLRTLFTSDYFKSDRARFARVKCPAELVVGAARLAGSYRTPTFGIEKIAAHTLYMGQGLLQPPSVEGWHEGTEWIDSGSMMERINFAARELGDPQKPGVRAIINRLASEGDGVLPPEQLVDRCLEYLGLTDVSQDTRETLVEFAATQGVLDLNGHQPGDKAEQQVGNVLRLTASTKEFQLA
ncbi:MAG: DUF1800 domain-containing protein [Chloroflexi bacterium]|nr:DUF1800 domain-containing protein [Chloroflexota bacterium]